MSPRVRRVIGPGLSVFTLMLVMSCRLEAEPYPERLPIGVIQGQVLPEDSGLAHRSPLVGERVVVRGVVHTILRWQAAAGHSLYGMMIQDLPAEADGDPMSSDGLFVYLGGMPELDLEGPGQQRINRGDLVTLRGEVTERFGQTQLDGAVLLAHQSGGDLDELLPPKPISLSVNLEETHRILERHQGMRVKLLPGAATVSGSFPNDRNRDMQVWVTPQDNPILQRETPAARRLFRGAHVLSDVPRDQWLVGHGMRLVLGSLGLFDDDRDEFLPHMTTGTVFPEPLVGGLHYSFGQYVLQVESMPEVRGGPTPSAWRIPAPEGSEERLRIVTYNIENLYDFIDNPFHDCDFPGNPGCPGVREPWNFVPPSDAHYREQLRIVARQIVEDLESPHILMLQEMENQDIGVMTPDGMVYGEVDNADGELDVVQELILKIVSKGGPVYTSAANRNSGDARGIITAYLYRADLFTPVHPEADHPIFGTQPDFGIPGDPSPMVHEVVNPKSFNFQYTGEPDGDMFAEIFSRAVQVFALEDREGRRLWLLNNHFSAIPGRRIERRTWQARVNARIARRIMELYPDDGVIVGGDLNMFPRPDDPTDPPSDQLGPLYRAGLFNVVDWVMEQDPSNASSYVFRGDAGILDHMFLSPGLQSRLALATYLHINADYPESFREDLPIRGSDHDPLLIELEW
jgi:predicted extracellular nuclease